MWSEVMARGAAGGGAVMRAAQLRALHGYMAEQDAMKQQEPHLRARLLCRQLLRQLGGRQQVYLTAAELGLLSAALA
ncbi:hypothetical protein [Chromobacterium amazonense]|uniref:Uncharacterized protein n=1 Tax=Chromobacterium amazonense TaxID=1382803 RepID=A0ABU8UY67_9NEIS|nr:hypothetical protein [Chromobacterium amazonense]MDQ4540975.1 hypothetical protein [Chromobacterium amazonense]